MDQKIEFKREDMTYEEFVILCAKLTGAERNNIIDPIDSLDAKTMLTDKISKKYGFFEFCIKNFLEMHHTISRLYLLEMIDKQLLFQMKGLSFELYDILVQKFFIECQPKISDISLNFIFKIQVKLFFILYDQEFWMQLFVCDDCPTYLLKRPEYMVIGFIENLANSIYSNKSKNVYIERMIKDGVITIMIKYLFEKSSEGISESMRTMFRMIELLDLSAISEMPIFDYFLNGLKENASNSIEFFSAVFSNGNKSKILQNEKKEEIIDFVGKKSFFDYFNEYLQNQSNKERSSDDNSISQFSSLLYNIFYPLFPQNFTEEYRDENKFLFPIFDHFCPIFFQTLVLLDAISGDYSKLLRNLSILLPESIDDLLKILFEKLSVLLTNSQDLFNPRTYIINYLDLYTGIQGTNENADDIYKQLFEKLETGIDNCERTQLFLSVLNEAIDYDEYNKSSINDVYDDEFDDNDNDEYDNQNEKKIVCSNYYSLSKITLLNSAVQYYEFILSDDFQNKDLYNELVFLYSKIVFKWTDTCKQEQWGIYIARIFSIAISHMYDFPSIIDLCLKKNLEGIEKMEGIDSIVLQLLSSSNRSLTSSGLKILKMLDLSPTEKDNIVIKALQNVIQFISDETHSQNFEFESVIPLFLSTSIQSNNEKRKENEQIDEQIVASIHDFMIEMKSQMDDRTINGWITSYLHFFGFIFFDGVRDIFDPIFQIIEREKEADSEAKIDFDFEKVTILAKQLKKLIPIVLSDKEGNFNDALEYVANIILYGTKKSERLIKEFTLDGSESIFAVNGYQMYSPPQNFVEAVDFVNEAAGFFVPLFKNTKLVEMYMVVLPFFKMCCSWPIIKRKDTLFSIFSFIVDNDNERIDEFLHCSFHLLHIIKNNGGYTDVLLAVALFHKILIQKDETRFLQEANSEIEIPKKYLKILCDTTIDKESDFENAVKKVFYKRRFK